MSLDETFIDAVDNCNLNKVKLLLLLGANIHYERDLALDRAVGNGDYNMVKFLLDSGAIFCDIEKAFAYAADNNFKKIMELMQPLPKNQPNNIPKTS